MPSTALRTPAVPFRWGRAVHHGACSPTFPRGARRGGLRGLHFPATAAPGAEPGSAKMAVDKELLERDLYGLLGVGEKASEKEVRGAGGSGRAPSAPSLPPSLSRCPRERRAPGAARAALQR